jgi:hypothetical protein
MYSTVVSFKRMKHKKMLKNTMGRPGAILSKKHFFYGIDLQIVLLSKAGSFPAVGRFRLSVPALAFSVPLHPLPTFCLCQIQQPSIL